ncbi:hypothetical protein HY642_02380 [Candidatus Woesearchaeota archaeon]|nr:hypothetical protein [Candidatus Woesearchaeota archaeon]
MEKHMIEFGVFCDCDGNVLRRTGAEITDLVTGKKVMRDGAELKLTWQEVSARRNPLLHPRYYIDQLASGVRYTYDQNGQVTYIGDQVIVSYPDGSGRMCEESYPAARVKVDVTPAGTPCDPWQSLLDALYGKQHGSHAAV